MANYVYLFETRLNAAQRGALSLVQETAKQHNLTAFLVGGAVRDLTAGIPVRDLDFVIQGSAGLLAADLEAAGAVRVGEQPELERFFFLFPGGVRVEVGSALNVTYPEPARPVVEPAPVQEDLRRRDFTVNAMAVSLNEGSYGLLMDPLNGIADLENRELRLVSPYGFIEEPSRLLRATRLAARLAFTLEERTQTRFENAKNDGAIERLGDFEKRYELEEVFHEEDPEHIVGELAGQGWDAALGIEWTPEAIDEDALNRLRELHGQLDTLGIHADFAATAFPLLTARMNPAKLAALKARFARSGFAAQIDSQEGKAKELTAKLTAQSAAAPSEIWKLLFASEPDTVLRAAYGARSGALQTRFKQFLTEWSNARQRIPYTQMAEMRIQPNLPGYDQLVEDLFFAVMDGKLDSPEAIRAYLEPIAPPAPPTATPPRRRAAKATKGKAKKAAAKTSAPDSAEDSTTDVAEEVEAAPDAEASAPAAKLPAKSTPPKPAAKQEASAAKSLVANTPAAKASPEKHAATKVAARTPAKEAKAQPLPAAKTPAKAAAVPAKKAPAKVPAKAASPARKAPAKAAPAKKVAAKAPVKAAAPSRKAPAKAATPARKTVAKVVAKKAAPARAVAKKAPAKTPLKSHAKKVAKAVKASRR